MAVSRVLCCAHHRAAQPLLGCARLFQTWSGRVCGCGSKHPKAAKNNRAGRAAPAASAGRTNRTPQQRDRRRTREERTGARPKRQAHTSAPRYDQGGDEQDRLRRTPPLQARRRAERGAPLWAALAKWPRPCRALAAARGRGFAASWPACPLSCVLRPVVE